MHPEYLVRMANDIGAFFASEPDMAQAAHGVRDHIERFWDPRMRSQIIAHHNSGGAGFSDIVARAIAELAAGAAAKQK